VTIHNEHPFLPPEAARSPVRRFRGRLPSPVSLWTAGQGTGRQRAGLTVSSTLVADGDPGIVVGLVDPLSDLWDVLVESGNAVVTALGWRDHQVADRFGYVAPAPGGPFAGIDWQVTRWGPSLSRPSTWAGCRLLADRTAEVGYGLLVQLEIEQVTIEQASIGESSIDDAAAADSSTHDSPTEAVESPLVHYHGRYRRLRDLR
jgi:flavin reductase (DIM6/NTAB) family NADH-FMN oxidoreductase RutF